jgi:hypothetical protein
MGAAPGRPIDRGGSPSPPPVPSTTRGRRDDILGNASRRPLVYPVPAGGAKVATRPFPERR